MPVDFAQVAAVAFIASAVVCGVMSRSSWRGRATAPAAVPLAAVQLAAACWAAGATGAVLDVPVPAQLVLRWVTYVGICASATAVWCLARAVTDPRWRPGRGTLLALCVEPLLVAVAVATDGLHHGFFVDTLVASGGTWPRLRWSFGPLFYAHALYCYALAVSGVVVLVRGRRGRPWYFRRQLSLVIVSSLLPVLGSAIFVLRPDLTHGVDWAPMVLAVSGGLHAVAVFRQGLIKVVPIARDRVVERLADAIFVIDTRGILLDLNARASDLLRSTDRAVPDAVVGRPAAGFVDPALLAAVEGGGGDGAVVALADGRHLDVRCGPIDDVGGRHLGRVFVVRDITDQVQQRRALEAAHADLTEQLRVNEQLRAQLSEEVVHDPLTGLLNRRALDEALRLQARRPVGAGIAMMVVDVDHFKQVNDAHGHPTGDRVLQAIANALLLGTRQGDVLVRWGGEEFVVLVPDLDAATARVRAEVLREACARTSAVAPGGALLKVTVSIGVAWRDDGDAAALVPAADEALYRAKAGGRDRVVLAAPTLGDALST